MVSDFSPVLCCRKRTQLHVEVPSESGGSNITAYLIDVDSVSTFSSTTLVTLTVDADEVTTRPQMSMLV